MDPDKTAPRSSLIRIHNVCLDVSPNTKNIYTCMIVFSGSMIFSVKVIKEFVGLKSKQMIIVKASGKTTTAAINRSNKEKKGRKKECGIIFKPYLQQKKQLIEKTYASEISILSINNLKEWLVRSWLDIYCTNLRPSK